MGQIQFNENRWRLIIFCRSFEGIFLYVRVTFIVRTKAKVMTAKPKMSKGICAKENEGCFNTKKIPTLMRLAPSGVYETASKCS